MSASGHSIAAAIWHASDTQAVRNLLMAPAPDLAALTFKLEVFRDEENYGLVDVEALIDEMIADAQRLGRMPGVLV